MSHAQGFWKSELLVLAIIVIAWALISRWELQDAEITTKHVAETAAKHATEHATGEAQMRALWKWIKSLFTKRAQLDEHVSQTDSWNPIIATAAEQERERMIIERVRQFLAARPRLWRPRSARRNRA